MPAPHEKGVRLAGKGERERRQHVRGGKATAPGGIGEASRQGIEARERAVVGARETARRESSWDPTAEPRAESAGRTAPPPGAPPPRRVRASRRFLPTTREQMEARGWDQLDFVYVSGAMRTSTIPRSATPSSRVCSNPTVTRSASSPSPTGTTTPPSPCSASRVWVFSFRRAIWIRWSTITRWRRSVVTRTPTPGGEAGRRPNHAAVVYANLIRRTYKKTPVILGGIEASLRRLAHYDYWSDKVKRSILLDSDADLVSYGMGERSIVEIADALDAGLSVCDLTFIDGTVFKTSSLEHVYDYELLPSWDQVSADKPAFARSFAVQYANADPVSGKRLVEPYSDHSYVVQNPPALPLTTAEMDAVYRLPYARTWHPSLRCGGRRARAFRGEVQPGEQPRMLRRMLVLRVDVSPGARRVGAQPRVADRGGAPCLRRPRLQRLHTRRGRSDGQLPRARVRKAAEIGCVLRSTVPDAQPCPALKVSHADYVELLRKLRALPG